jgi:hypothetical protein
MKAWFVKSQFVEAILLRQQLFIFLSLFSCRERNRLSGGSCWSPHVVLLDLHCAFQII